MAHPTTVISLLGAGLAFGAACATLALMGLGAPVLVAAVLSSACAGLVLHAALLAHMARPLTALQDQLRAAQAESRDALVTAAKLAEVEVQAAALRHDLRGVLSPALMVTDRLLSNPDPAVQRAGQAIVRSVDRATAIIQASKGNPATSADVPAGPAAG